MAETEVDIRPPPRVGDPAPPIKLATADKKVFELAEALKDGPVILAFFPFAFTSTCTKELCIFTSRFGGLDGTGAQVVGISCDAPYSQAAWATQEKITTPLASDFNKDVSAAYGVLYPNWKGIGRTAKRSVFVVDREGIVRFAWVAENADLEPDYEAVRSVVAKLMS